MVLEEAKLAEIINDVEKLIQITKAKMEVFQHLLEREREVINAIQNFREYTHQLSQLGMITPEEKREHLKNLISVYNSAIRELKNKKLIFKQIKKFTNEEKKLIGFLSGKAMRLQIGILKREFKIAKGELNRKASLGKKYNTISQHFP